MDKADQLDTVLAHVEPMLDVLLSQAQTAAEFKTRCQALEAYLAANPLSPDPTEVVNKGLGNRLGRVVDKLNKLSLRAHHRADIPTGLQKFIAEQQN